MSGALRGGDTYHFVEVGHRVGASELTDEVLLGQLKLSRSYRSREVFFSEQIFGMKFATALALFAHEHSHVFGYDSSRGYTDCLTELLESAIANRGNFERNRRRIEFVHQ